MKDANTRDDGGDGNDGDPARRDEPDQQVSVSAPGFRRRILIEPEPGMVTARLEDDWHRMAVTLHHHDAIITAVTSVMDRAPWTTCPGAVERLQASFFGIPLAAAARRGDKTANCTHLYDLAIHAAAHWNDALPTAYEVEVSDPIDTRQTASLRRNGAVLLEWEMAAGRLAAPPAVAGRRLTELGEWIAGLDPGPKEAARLLRWATMMSAGRQMAIADYSSGTRFANGTCFTFQPDRAAQAARLPDAHRDLSAPGRAPLADRPEFFVRRRSTV